MEYDKTYVCKQEQEFIDNMKLTAEDDAALLNHASIVDFAELVKEEAAEITQAVSKLTRLNGVGFKTRASEEEVMKMIIEESSDILTTTLFLAIKLNIVEEISKVSLLKAKKFNKLNGIDSVSK